jgi:hypothetical protein
VLRLIGGTGECGSRAHLDVRLTKTSGPLGELRIEVQLAGAFAVHRHDIQTRRHGDLATEISQPLRKLEAGDAGQNYSINVSTSNREKRRGTVQRSHTGENPHSELHGGTVGPVKHASLMVVERELHRTRALVDFGRSMRVLRTMTG